MWLLRDYARYWYALGVLLLIVFGIGEFARRSSPLSAGVAAGLFLLLLLTLAAGVVGYLLLWRRETPAGQWVLWILRSIRGLPSRFLGSFVRRRAGGAADAHAPNDKRDRDQDERGDREPDRPIG